MWGYADESGTITEGELRKIMSSFNKPLSEEEMREILKYAKVKDGRVFYKDFIKTILTGKFEWYVEWYGFYQIYAAKSELHLV